MSGRPLPLLLFGETESSADLFHAIPLVIVDPFPYVEDGERRVAVLPAMEAPRVAGSGLEVLDPWELGRGELLESGLPHWEVELETAVRGIERTGLRRFAVPLELPVGLADRLRARGFELVVDPARFEARRRAKTPEQLAGIRRAQAAAEAAMTRARELIVGAADGLTSERVRAEMAGVCDAHGCDLPDDVVVAHGQQAVSGHEPGSGPIRAGDVVSVDIWPRDRASRCWADFKRTYVAGGGPLPEPFATWHRLAVESITAVHDAIRPGASCRDLYELSAQPFVAAGEPTRFTAAPGEALHDGYWWALGHGVGLQVHEPPLLTRIDDELVEGDVIAIEPGCVRTGVGAVGIEDLVLVTAGGAERLTHFPYDPS